MDADIDEWLTQPNKEDILKPFSSRVKLVIEYEKAIKRYVISDKDQEVLSKYMTVDEFMVTTK